MKHSNYQSTSHKGCPPENERVAGAVPGAPAAAGEPSSILHPPSSSGAREEFLAANPGARVHQAAFEREFKERYARWRPRALPAVKEVISLTEEARQMGIVLLEFVESLPGKKLTVDFYEQLKSTVFRDEHGQTIALELLEWFMRTARNNALPITSFRAADKYNQPVLFEAQAQAIVAEGEVAEGLYERVQAAMLKNRVPPKDAWTEITDWFEGSAIEEQWSKLKANPHYYPDGHLREDLREMYAAHLAPKFKVLDELRRELGI